MPCDHKKHDQSWNSAKMTSSDEEKPIVDFSHLYLQENAAVKNKMVRNASEPAFTVNVSRPEKLNLQPTNDSALATT